MLENPVLVLESQGQSMRPGTRKNSRIVVVGNVTDANGAPVLCVMDLAPGTGTDRKLGLQDFNKVSSAYPKDVNPRGFLEKSNVLYAEPDMEKTGAALSAFGFKLATSAPGSTGVIGSITYENGDVKIKGVPFTEIFGNENKTKEWFQVRGNRVPLDGTSFGLIRSIQLGDADVKYSEKISGAVTQEELEKARAEYREAERALKDS